MFNLEENFELNAYYNTQKDWIFRSLAYSTGSLIWLDWTRGQVPEINLLQLIPGFSLFLFFVSFLFLFLFSTFFINLSRDLEKRKNVGTKTFEKLASLLTSILSFFFFSLMGGFNFLTVIPISLDSFSTYGEKNLENLWSFNEVLNLESIFFFFLSLISQFPLFALSSFFTERESNIFSNFWKFLLLFLVIGSGFLTPTVDGYTQLSFSFSGFFVCFTLLALLKKRSWLKYQGSLFLGF